MLKITKRILRRLKWGIAGCGHFTENAFLPTLQNLAKSKLVSVYSSDISRAKFISDKFASQNYFNNYDEFLKSDIDCVYIGSANINHCNQVIKAAEAGKNILCEKPIAMNYKQAKEMVETCENNNVLLAVNYVHRFHPNTIKAKEMIAKGMIGKIISINTNFNIDLIPGSNFRFVKELSGGGALRDLGTHMIDILRFLGGEIVTIDGVMDSILYKSEVDDFSAGIAQFANGGYGIFNVSFNAKKPINRVEILGHTGNIIIENLIGKRGVPCKLIIDLDGEAKKAFRNRANKLLYALRSVQRSFLNNSSPVVTGIDGMINMKLMEELEQKSSNRLS